MPNYTPLVADLVRRIDADPRPAAQIARAAGVSGQYISDLRAGTRGDRITLAHAARIYQALGVRASEFGRLAYELTAEKDS